MRVPRGLVPRLLPSTLCLTVKFVVDTELHIRHVDGYGDATVVPLRAGVVLGRAPTPLSSDPAARPVVVGESDRRMSRSHLIVRSTASGVVATDLSANGVVVTIGGCSTSLVRGVPTSVAIGSEIWITDRVVAVVRECVPPLATRTAHVPEEWWAVDQTSSGFPPRPPISHARPAVTFTPPVPALAPPPPPPIPMMQAPTDRGDARLDSGVMATLALGMLSIATCGLTSIPSVVIGVLSLRNARRRQDEQSARLALFGSGVGALVLATVLLAVALR
jgi:hypothetical protein